MENKNEIINYNDAALKKALIDTVAKGANDSEFTMFANFCQTTGLNPFKKEIWFIKTKSNLQMMTGINGFLAIANQMKEFDGMEVVEGGTPMTIKLKKNNDNIESIVVPEYIEVKAYRKDRKFPSVARAYWSEYAKTLITEYGYLSIWAKMPRVMLAKCAKSMALREAFPQQLNGLYTVEEMPPEYELKDELPKTNGNKKPGVYPVVNRKYLYDVQDLIDSENRESVLLYIKKNGAAYDEDKKIVTSLIKLPKLSSCNCEVVEVDTLVDIIKKASKKESPRLSDEELIENDPSWDIMTS